VHFSNDGQDITSFHNTLGSPDRSFNTPCVQQQFDDAMSPVVKLSVGTDNPSLTVLLVSSIAGHPFGPVDRAAGKLEARTALGDVITALGSISSFIASSSTRSVSLLGDSPEQRAQVQT